MSTPPDDFSAQIAEGLVTAHLAATFAGFPVYVHTIEHTEGVVLVDTGMIDSTPELDEEGAPVPMPENIPRGVVCVINTHLHFDHCGGNRLFPGVPIHVQRLELQGPHDPHEWVDFPGATYLEHDGEAEVLPGIRLLPTPGHTTGHQSVLVDTPDGPRRHRRRRRVFVPRARERRDRGTAARACAGRSDVAHAHREGAESPSPERGPGLVDGRSTKGEHRMTSDGPRGLPGSEETDGQLAVGQLLRGRRPPDSELAVADNDR